MAERRRRMRAEWCCVEEVERGRRYRLRFWADTLDGTGYRRHSETVRGTRRDAMDRRDELRREYLDAPHGPASAVRKPTIGEAYERWYLAARARQVEDGDLTEASYAQLLSTWRAHVSPRWSDVRIDAVRPLDVQEWLDGMRYTAARTSLGLLRAVGDYCVRYGCVPTNPFRERYLMPSKSTVKTRDKGVWTLPELVEMWGAVSGTVWECAFLLSAFGSCRVGESLAAHAAEVERMDVGGVTVALVPIKRQVVRGSLTITDTLKTSTSYRTVAIAGPAGERVIEAAEMMGDGLLVRDDNGLPISQGAYTSEIRRVVESCGLSWYQARNFRNSWQTFMRWDWGVPPYMLEPMMGHVGEGVTGRHYDRPMVEQYARAVADGYARCPYDAPALRPLRTIWDISEICKPSSC